MMHYGLCYTNDEGTKNFSERALLVGENSAASIMSKCDRTIWNIYGNFLANIKFYEQLFPCTLTLSFFGRVAAIFSPLLPSSCCSKSTTVDAWLLFIVMLLVHFELSLCGAVLHFFFFAGNVIWLNVWFLLKMKYYFLLLTHPLARPVAWEPF